MKPFDTQLLARRQFMTGAAAAMLLGMTVKITGCGLDESEFSKLSDIEPGDIAGSISQNHGHLAVVKSFQLLEANRLTLDITGEASHSHFVELTAEQVRTIAQGQTIQVQSTRQRAHGHMVTFNG